MKIYLRNWENQMSSNAQKLIIINTIRKIIDVFLGPFLTVYFFKLSTDSISIVSLYNIFSYIVIVVISFIIGMIIKNRYEIQIFSLGMISKFIQLLILILLGENVIKYIWLVAIISGFSTITWSFPLNLFSSTIVANDEKKEFVVYKTMFANIVKVVTPIIFGSLISVKSFEKTAIIVLVLSFIQILISFGLKYKKSTDVQKFNLLQEYKKLKTNKNVKELFKAEFFQGMTYEGALDTAVTLLIIIAFAQDFSLGVVTSIISILSIFSAYICKKIINPQKIKFTILTACIVPFISTIILLLLTNNYTIVGYNIIYAFFIQMISIIKDVQTITLMNSKAINGSNRVEAYVLLEIFLGAGRVISYILLLLVGFLKEFYLLKILIIILTLCISLQGKHLMRIDTSTKESFKKLGE